MFACRIIISFSRWYFRWWLSRCIHQFWPSPDLKVVRGYGRQLVSGPISSNHGQQTIFNRAPATPAKQVSDPRLPSTAPLSKQVRVDQPSNSGSNATRSLSFLCSSRCGLHWVKYYSPPKIFRFISAPPRYYLAEGVRIYSQETWKMVTALEEGGGRQVVIDHIDSVVSYYITSTKYVCLRLLSILGRGRKFISDYAF